MVPVKNITEYKQIIISTIITANTMTILSMSGSNINRNFYFDSWSKQMVVTR